MYIHFNNVFINLLDTSNTLVVAVFYVIFFSVIIYIHDNVCKQFHTVVTHLVTTVFILNVKSITLKKYMEIILPIPMMWGFCQKVSLKSHVLKMLE